jgi:Hsp20/alpha crystallin family.
MEVVIMSTYLPSVFGENLMDAFDDLDRNFFRGFTRPEHVLYGRNAQHMMKTDVKETDEGYEVDVDLPGFKKEEIKLNLGKWLSDHSDRESTGKEAGEQER